MARMRYLGSCMKIVRKIEIRMFGGDRKSIEFSFAVAIVECFAFGGRSVLIWFSRWWQTWRIHFLIILKLLIRLLSIFAGRCFGECVATVLFQRSENILHFVHLFVICLNLTFQILKKLYGTSHYIRSCHCFTRSKLTPKLLYDKLQ